MELTTIEVNIGGKLCSLKAVVCPSCHTKVYPINTLEAHKESHTVIADGLHHIVCKSCEKTFTYPTESGPLPTICGQCKANKIDYSKRKKPVSYH